MIVNEFIFTSSNERKVALKPKEMENINLSGNAKKVLGMFDNYSCLRKIIVTKCREAGMERGEYAKAIKELKDKGVITSYEVLPRLNPDVYDVVRADYAVTLYVINK